MKISKSAKAKSKLTKDEWREYTKTVWHIANVSDKDHPAVFPLEIPSRLIKLFSFVGETVLDPFGGTGVTARAALGLARRATCIEQSSKYAQLIKRRCVAAHPSEAKTDLEVIVGDSRRMSTVPNESVQLVVTSPPYWNKADYGNGPANLGTISGYQDFLDEMRHVFFECYRVLEPGRKFCVVTANVNQHTNHGLLTFPLATDFAVLMREIGFVIVNEVIWSKDGTGGRWGSSGQQRPIFGSYPYPPNFLFKNVHEYIIIGAKPPTKKTKGPKVQDYRSLMERADKARKSR